LSRRIVLVLVVVLFIMSIPVVAADAYPINLKIGPKTTAFSSYYSLVVGDVFGISVTVTGDIDIQILVRNRQDVATWRDVTGYLIENMTIKNDDVYTISFYNLNSSSNAFVEGYIWINDYVFTNTTIVNTTTTTTINNNPPQDFGWLIPPLVMVSGALIIIIVGCLCRGRGEDLHFLLNIEEALFGLPEETTED